MNTGSTVQTISSQPLPPRPTVSVVIVVWNAKKYVIECLESLRDLCGEVCDEVIIVDNASSDGTPELIAEVFPEFKLIRNSENLGFAKANNIGMAQCVGDYVCLVNSDVKFTSDCFSPMLRFLAENPGIAMVGPKMVGPDGKVWRSTMRFPTLWNQFCRALGLDLAFKKSRVFGGYLMSDFDHQTTTPVEVLNGWFVVVRRTALERVGLLDPQFFMYGEDVDWCYRFHQAGEGIVFFAEAEAIHYGGASSANAPLRFYLEQCYADWQYWRKHHGRLSQMAYLASFATSHLVRMLGSAASYVFLPAQRSESLSKIKRSLICLRWVSRPQRNPLEMKIDFGAQKQIARRLPSSGAKGVSFRAQLGRVRRKMLCSLYRRPVPLGDQGPIVSFTFDDFPRSAYSAGGAILEQFGARGTYYVAGGLMNTSNELGELFVENDLHSLVEKGHELGTQTFRHSSGRSVSLADLQDDVQKGMQAVEDLAGHSSANFAYPYGHITLRAKKTLGPRLTSSRSVVPGLNGPEVDLNLLRANRLYGGMENAQEVEDLILENVKQRGWLIFYTHDVRTNPSEYGCTPALLEFAVSLAAKRGCRILAVQETLAELGVGSATAKPAVPRRMHAG